MSDSRASMMHPPIESLLDKVDSKFTLVTLAAKRGREINLYYNQLGEGLGAIVPPQVTSTARKPLSIAMEEISQGKIVYVQRSEEEVQAAETAAADAIKAQEQAARDAALAAAAELNAQTAATEAAAPVEEGNETA